MGEVVVPPDNVERRSTTVHQQTHNSAGVAASMPKYDRDSRLPHPGAPVGYKNDQAVTSDHRSPPWDRQQSTWERWPRSHKHHLMAVLHLPGTARHHHLTAKLHPPRTDARHHHRTAKLHPPKTDARHHHLTAKLHPPRTDARHHHRTAKLHPPKTDARHHHLTAVQRLPGISGLTAELQLPATATHLLKAVLRLPGIARFHHLVNVLHLLEIAGHLRHTALLRLT